MGVWLVKESRDMFAMAKQLVKLARNQHHHHATTVRHKTTASLVASRPRDPTFEKLMAKYSNLLKVITIQDLILANPTTAAVSLDFLAKLSQRLHLNRGAAVFLRRFPHVFRLSHNPSLGQTLCSLAAPAISAFELESAAVNQSLPAAVDRLVRLLSISSSRTVPLRAVFAIWRELGLPDDFEDSVLSQNPNLFTLVDNPRESGTHLLKLAAKKFPDHHRFTAAVETWRVAGDGCCGPGTEYIFKQSYPPGMKLNKGFRAKVRKWQSLPFVGPYDHDQETPSHVGPSRAAAEKRAVAILHEFLSLTVEKMVELEKFSHFKGWFGVELSSWGLVLNHPGIFYLSTKGKRNTVFLREAYERGRLVCPDPVHVARRKLLDLVVLGRHDLMIDRE